MFPREKWGEKKRVIIINYSKKVLYTLKDTFKEFYFHFNTAYYVSLQRRI